MINTNMNGRGVQQQSTTQGSELAELLTQGKVEDFNRSRQAGSIDLSRIVIPKDTNLSGVNLSGAVLTGAQLSNVNLSGADLTGADLTQADLSYANLQAVKASKANFDRSTLNYAVGSGGVFSEANLASAHMMRSTFENADFVGAKMQLALLQSACFRGSDFSGANLSGARMKEASFEKAGMVEAVLTKVDFHGTNFSGADLSKASLKAATGKAPRFRDACLQGADLTSIITSEPDFSRAYVKEMKHGFGENRAEYLKGAFNDKDADPKDFFQRRAQTANSGLIMNRPGTDSQLLLEVRKEIEALVGLPEVKDKIQKMIDGFQINELGKQLGEPTDTFKQHLAFIGEPGTGKTTIARLWGKALKAFGYLEKGHVVEVPGRELVVGKIGQSEEKTREYVNRAIGGILFVDEAHQLAKEGSEVDFGREVIGTIVHNMTNHAGEFVTIFAGYKEPMEKLFKMDQGLKSRLTDLWHFEGYDSGQLVDILGRNLKRRNLVATKEYICAASLLCGLADIHYKEQFGNARFVEDQILGKSRERQNQRIVKEGILQLSDAAKQREMLRGLVLEDLPSEEIIGLTPQALLEIAQELKWSTNGKELTYKDLPNEINTSEPFPNIGTAICRSIYKTLSGGEDYYEAKDSEESSSPR
jgi:uncharacterized protein YjbI with pentapeptide repeats/Cdc6-like AAA superfamily ATPase